MKIRNRILKFSLSLAAALFTVITGHCFLGSAHAQLVRAKLASASSPYGYENSATQACGCGAAVGCGTCGGCGRIPVAAQMCPPQQPQGVTSGTCKPCITGIDCAQDPYGEKRWRDARPIDFQPLWHGEYIGPVRLPSLLEYRVRINDEVTFTYIPNRQKRWKNTN